MDQNKIKTKFKSLKPNICLNVSIEIIRYLGNWPPQGYRRFVYFIFSAFIFTFMVGHLIIGEVGIFIVNRRNLSKIVSATPFFLTNIVHAYKYFLIMKYQKRIQNMLHIANGQMFSKNNKRYERIISWYSWHDIFHYVAFETISLIGVFFLAFAPLNGERKPPLIEWFPYDPTKSPAFEIIWLHQILSLILCCTSNIAMDVLISGLLNVVSCQFELLKWNIATIGNDDSQKKEKQSSVVLKMLDDEIYKKLTNCIEHNIAIFNFVAEIQDIFGTAIFLQLFINCLIICLTTFSVTQLNNFFTADMLGHVAYILAMMYQIFIYCWHGNELHFQNESLSSAIYMSGWLNFSKRFNRALNIMMLRSRRPLVIKAGFLMTLSLSTFVAVIKKSYSLFAVLRSTLHTELKK